MLIRKLISLIRGGQLISYQSRMFVQVIGRMSKWAIITYAVIVIILMLLLMPGVDWHILVLQCYAALLHWLGLGHVHVWTSPHDLTHFISANYWLHSKEQRVVGAAFSHFIKHGFIALAIGLVIYCLITRLSTRLFIKAGEKYAGDRIISGTRLATSFKETRQAVKKSAHGPSDIRIANVLALPRFSVWQGILYHGSTGTGKSQNLMRLLDDIEASGDPVIIYDKESTLKPYFFREGLDRELNPLSHDCELWDMWAECSNPIELAALALYLMPKAVQGSDPFWVDAARVIFTSTAWEMRKQTNKAPIKLLQTLLTTQLDELRKLLAKTEAENLVNKDIEKTAISIRAVMATYTKSLRFLAGLEKHQYKQPFAIKAWIKAQSESRASKKSWLWITSRARFHGEIKPLLSAWLGLAMRGIQSLDPHKNKHKRFWIIIDEMASLHRLEDLVDVAADIRKFGGCLVVGWQNINQMKFIYGHDEATALSDLLNTACYSRSPKAVVAQWVSKDLGSQEIEEVRESQSYGPNAIRDGNTLGSQRVTRSTVDTSTIMQMEDLTCYVRLAGNYPITLLKFPYIERALKASATFVERDIDWDAIKQVSEAVHVAQHHPDIDAGAKYEQTHNQMVDIVSHHPELADDPEKLTQPSHQAPTVAALLDHEKKEPVLTTRDNYLGEK